MTLNMATFQDRLDAIKPPVWSHTPHLRHPYQTIWERAQWEVDWERKHPIPQSDFVIGGTLHIGFPPPSPEGVAMLEARAKASMEESIAIAEKKFSEFSPPTKEDWENFRKGTSPV